jgi:FkbH-like protein
LLATGYFEAVSFSPEDRQRADFYRDNARRIALRRQAGDLDSYLASLEMRITFAPFDNVNRARIAQLINKSNQYNLTTRRYTESEVKELQRDPDCFTLQVRLSDAFGDNGMISVVICRRRGEDLEVDTWLMSCRVLNRKVEVAVLMELLDHARAKGIRRILGRYIRTERNGLVRDHYAKLGFVQTDSQPNGATDWALEVATAPRIEVPMVRQRCTARP